MAGRHAAVAPARSGAGRAATATVLAGVGAVTGSFALSSATAEAAPIAVDWNKLAACEASGDWAINSGNGFSGGLQFTQDTWEAFGGLQYAPTAAQASMSQQIAVAKQVLQGQGIGAWPVCGPKAVQGAATGGVSVTPAVAPAAPRAMPTIVETAAPVKAAVKMATPVAKPAAPAVTPKPAVVVPPPALASVAAAAPEAVNPNCVALKRAGVPVGALNGIWRARPELGLDGNGNGVPCDVTYPRTAPALAPAAAPAAVRAPVAAVKPATPTVQTVANTTTTSASSSVAAKRAAILATARSWEGVPYLYGGTTRAGVDCSGLVQRVMAANGINLPRTAEQQYNASTHITRAQLLPGDLVFGVSAEGVHHVGIWLGNGKQIDAQQDGVPVAVHALYPDQTLAGRVVT